MKSEKLKVKSKSPKLKVTFALTTFILLLGTSHFSLLTSHFPQFAVADMLSNPNYSVDVDSVDTNPQPTPKTPKEILGSMTQSIKNPFTSGPNYSVNTSNDRLTFTLSQNAIDLGILSGRNPVIRTSQLALKNKGQVLTYENHPLEAQDRTPIFDTTCDNGSCSEITAAFWLSSLTYGFGYRCDSNNTTCDSQFKTSNTYKQYPDNSKTELPQPLITNLLPATSSTMVTYKVTISATQKQEGYYNTITYLAIPNF